MSVVIVVCSAGRGLCDCPISLQGESYRLYVFRYVIKCNDTYSEKVEEVELDVFHNSVTLLKCGANLKNSENRQCIIFSIIVQCKITYLEEIMYKIT